MGSLRGPLRGEPFVSNALVLGLDGELAVDGSAAGPRWRRLAHPRAPRRWPVGPSLREFEIAERLGLGFDVDARHLLGCPRSHFGSHHEIGRAPLARAY